MKYRLSKAPSASTKKPVELRFKDYNLVPGNFIVTDLPCLPTMVSTRI